MACFYEQEHLFVSLFGLIRKNNNSKNNTRDLLQSTVALYLGFYFFRYQLWKGPDSPFANEKTEVQRV